MSSWNPIKQPVLFLLDIAKKIMSSPYLKLIALFIMLQCKPVFAQDFISERSYYEDATGAMTLKQVKTQKFKPYQNALSEGYSQSTYWLRLKVEPLVQSNFRSLLLRIQPGYLDFIQMYDDLEPKNPDRVQGTLYSANFNDYNSTNFNFVIPGSDKQRYIWLKIKSKGSIFVRTQALTINTFIDYDLIQKISESFYIGILFFLFLVPFTIWIKDKEWLNFAFVLKQFAALLLVSLDTGVHRLLFTETSPVILNSIFNTTALSYTGVAIFFHYIFLRDYHMKSWVKISFAVLAVTIPFGLFKLLISDQISFALELNNIVLTLLAILFIAIPFYGLSWEKNVQSMFSQKFIIAIHWCIGLSMLLTTLPLLGIFKGSSYSMVPGLLNGSFTGIIFLFVLQYRNRMFRDQKAIEIQQATAMANYEKARRQEKERFISMLTHELKTPLAVLKLAYEGTNSTPKDKHIESALRDINDVIDRCALEDKLENQGFKPLIEPHSLKRVIYQKISEYDISDHFKFIVEQDITIDTDINLLRIILTNIIDNAMKYGDPTKPIIISNRIDNHPTMQYPAVITISNTVGDIGVPEEDKVFTKYYRSEKAHKYTGSGLGLYLVSSIAKLLKGEVMYLHNPQLHTVTFKLILPIKQ